MKPYGSRRNWNHLDDYVRNAEARSKKKQRRLTKQMHRAGRRVAKSGLLKFLKGLFK